MTAMCVLEPLKRAWRSGNGQLASFFLLLLVMVINGMAQQTGPHGNGNAKPQQIKAVVVATYPQGFTPRTEEISDRKIMLIVEPRGPVRQLDLSLDRLGTNGQPIGNLKNGKANGTKNNWVGVIDLQPGQYRLTDKTNPTHVFVLTVH